MGAPPVGSRVLVPSLGQSGIIFHVHGTMATVRTPSGTRTVPWADLVPESDDPLEMLGEGNFGDDPDWFEVRLRAARLEAAYGSDELSGLTNSRVVLRPHQIFVAHRILEKPRPSMIIADEVGLGKTVEAGLVLKELLARRSVDRILILAPPNLLNQWQTEMRVKFNEEFDIIDRARLDQLARLSPNQNPWSKAPRALVSTYLARAEDVRDQLQEVDWGLVIVDEAHHCRRRMNGGATQLYRTVDALKDRATGVMLLTATPMQLHPSELFGLVELVEPGLFQDLGDFDDEAFASSETQRAIRALQNWADLSDDERRNAQRLVASHGVHLQLRTAAERELAVDQLLATVRITRAIVRNRKRVVGGFTRRIARTLSVELSNDELETQSLVMEYLRRGLATADEQGDRLLGFELVTFQRMLASSSAALAGALANRRTRLRGETAPQVESTDESSGVPTDRAGLVFSNARDEMELLDTLIQRLAEARDSKVEDLVELVRSILTRDHNEKVLIFTQFLATQRLISERLAGFGVCQFNGRMTRTEKDQAVSRFRDHARVMVSTESGGEGRNFQFCHILVNYDLHWNPMRVEQRIGRLDRYGQRKNVHIYNLVATGSIEDRLLSVFQDRLRLFESNVGALELVLGDFESDLQAALVAAGGDTERAIERFERDLELKLLDAERVEEQSADFLIELSSFAREEAERLRDDLGEERVRVDLERLVIHVLELFPTARVEIEDEDVYHLTIPPALARSLNVRLEDRYVGTFSAATGVENESLDFFAFGHPVVDACLSYATGDLAGGRTGCRTLPRAVLGSPAIELHYVAELRGVRKWKREVPLVFDFDGRRLPDVESQLPFAGPAEPAGRVAPREALDKIRDLAIDAVVDYLEAQREAFDRLNERWVDQERWRAERIQAYNLRRISDRVNDLNSLIQQLEEQNDPDRVRIVPALRGQIASAQREQETLKVEFDERLVEIDRLASISENIELVNAALLVPAE